ncbi:glycerophosphodiester phosphodiesterase [Spirillospora sp. NPDC050679]
MPTSPRQPVFTSPPVVIGHRGLGEAAVAGQPENCVASVLSAVRAGLGWVELDVRRTADDRLVVLHHPTSDDGQWLSEMTGDQVAALGVPSLDEVLAAVPPEVGLDLDLKSSVEDASRPRERTTAGLLAERLRAGTGDRPLLVTSFDAAALLIVRELAPRAPLGLLTWYGFPFRKAVPMAAHLGLDAVVVETTSFEVNPLDGVPLVRSPERQVAAAHEVGLEVVVWCPGPAACVELVAAGVDAVIVDEAAAVLAALAAAAGKGEARRDGAAAPRGA